jgi:hypothetical protein
MAGLFTFFSNFADRNFKNQLQDKIREIDSKFSGYDEEIERFIESSGGNIAELVDARKDENNVVYTTLKQRLDVIGQNTSAELDNLKQQNSLLADKLSPSGVPANATGPTFTRPSVRTYRGRDYTANVPVYDTGGIYIDPTLSESLTIPTANIINATEGTIEITIIPKQLIDTVNYCRIDFPTTGRFLLFVNAAGKVSFSIDEWSAGSVGTENGVAKLNEPFEAALRWNHRAKEYSLFVNGKKAGTTYYDRTVKGDFGASMSVVYNYPAIVQKLRISHIARPDKELRY